MEFAAYFPIWDKLSEDDRQTLAAAAQKRSAPKGTPLHSGSADCVGLFLVESGQLRAYILSEEGREVTLYRLFERDVCLFSASCMLASIQFEIMIEAEKDSALWVIPAEVYRRVMESSAVLANYTNEIMATRFTEVMWLIEQIMWKSMDKRLAEFLLSESALEEADRLAFTHERIANHMGTAREVVTRMLRYFQAEGMVELTRGGIQLTDRKKLARIAG